MKRADYEALRDERTFMMARAAESLRALGYTYRNIGEALGVSPERARQLVYKGVRQP